MAVNTTVEVRLSDPEGLLERIERSLDRRRAKPAPQERRALPVELRVEKRDGEAAKIVGHAAVFDKLSEDLGGFREKIAPGAFTEAIASDDVRALWNHDPNFVLGRNKSGTLRLAEDEHGLAIEIDPPDTQWARDLLVTMERGDVSQMSFGFRAVDDEWEKKDGENIRTLKKARLFDVSPVTYPAYPDTDVAVRELRAWLEQQTEVAPERTLAVLAEVHETSIAESP